MENCEVDDNNKKAEVLKRLYENPFFAELSPQQMRVAALYWQLKRCPENFTLFNENDDPDCMYYVLEGRLSVLKNVKDRRGNLTQVKVAEIVKDQLLGELAIIEDSKRSATVVTLEPTNLLMIKEKHFNLLVKSQPQIGVILLKQVAKLISRQLRSTTGRFAELERSVDFCDTEENMTPEIEMEKKLKKGLKRKTKA